MALFARCTYRSRCFLVSAGYGSEAGKPCGVNMIEFFIGGTVGILIGGAIFFIASSRREAQLRRSILSSENEIKSACRQLDRNADELERLHRCMDKARMALSSTNAPDPAPHGATPGDLH